MRSPSVRGRKRQAGLISLLVTLLLAVAWAPALQTGDAQPPPDIVVTQLHMFITRSEGGLAIGEYYLLSNTGERTYAGVEDPQTGERVTVSFTLPEGARGLLFDGPGLGERFVETEGGFADTEPIPPGMATVEVLFTYELPYSGEIQMERTFEVPVASVVLVIAEEGLALAGDGVTSAGVVDTQMGPALSYTAGPLEMGEPLIFSVVADQSLSVVVPETPAAETPALGRNTARGAAIGLAAMAVAMIVTYLLWRSPAPGPCPVEARPLVEEIAALDAGFEAGRMEEGAYRQKRGALKQRVRMSLEKNWRVGS
jgi:hypothetical protein